MTVSEQIISVIDTLCAKAGIVIDWTSANVIPYLEMLSKKMITYEICISTLVILLHLLIMGCIVVVAKKVYASTTIKLDDFDKFMSCVCLCGLLVLCMLPVSDAVRDIVKCLTFPEMYIFEYISALMPK